MLKTRILTTGMLFVWLMGCAKENKHATNTVPFKVSLAFPEGEIASQSAELNVASTGTVDDQAGSSSPGSTTNKSSATSSAVNSVYFEDPVRLLERAEERFAHKRVFRWFSYRILNGSTEIKRGSVAIENRDTMSLDAIEFEAKVNDKLQLDFSFMQVDFMNPADADGFCQRGAPGFVRTWKASQLQTVRDGGEISLTFNQNGRSIVQMGVLRVPWSSTQDIDTSQWKATLKNNTTGSVLGQNICHLERSLSADHGSETLYLRAPVFAVPLESLQFLFTINTEQIPTTTVDTSADIQTLEQSARNALAELRVAAAHSVEKSNGSWFLRRNPLSSVFPTTFFPRVPLSLAEDSSSPWGKKVEVRNSLFTSGGRLAENTVVEVIDGSDTQCDAGNVLVSGVSQTQNVGLPLIIQGGARNYRLRIRTTSRDGFVTCSTHALEIDVPGFQPDEGEGKVALGHNHTCAIREGALYCWGNNSMGQLGDGTQTNSSAPKLVDSLGRRVLAVAAGNQFTCAIVRESDTLPRALKCWGENANNRFSISGSGNGTGSTGNTTTTQFVTTPTTIVFDPTENRTLKVAADGDVICSIQAPPQPDTSESGRLYCWRDSTKATDSSNFRNIRVARFGTIPTACGLTGSGATKCFADTTSPILGGGSGTVLADTLPVNTTLENLLSSATSLHYDAGSNHVCAIRSTGLSCIGTNNDGQFGNGETSSTSISSPSTPITGFRKIAAFSNSTCGISDSGELKCWGQNDRAQLGFESSGSVLTPTLVTTLAAGVTDIFAAEKHACAVANGFLKCWGENNNGQLGRKGTDSELDFVVAPAGSAVAGTPVQSLAVGMYSGNPPHLNKTHQCAVQSGRLLCWGYNDEGQLGTGSTSSGFRDAQTPTDLASGVAQVATGREHTCAIVSSNAEVKCWGRNDFDQLGLGNTLASGSSVDLRATQPTSLSPRLSGARVVAAGESHSCAIAGERLYCWGNNSFGQLGVSDDRVRSPREIPVSASSVSAVATRRGHTCVLSSERQVFCFGENQSGQLGNGTTSPSPTAGATSTPALAATATPTAAPTATASTTTTDAASSTPVLDNATHIAVGNEHSCAVQDGRLLCWGSNTFGQLGQVSSLCRESTPRVVDGFESEVTDVAAGEHHTCAIKSGALWCWGRSDFGQLGTGRIVSVPATDNQSNCPTSAQPWGVHTPTLILAAGVTSVSAGGGTCAVLYGREVKCWGIRSNKFSATPAGVVGP